MTTKADTTGNRTGRAKLKRHDKQNNEHADGRRLRCGTPKTRYFSHRLGIADRQKRTRAPFGGVAAGLSFTPLARFQIAKFHGPRQRPTHHLVANTAEQTAMHAISAAACMRIPVGIDSEW